MRGCARKKSKDGQDESIIRHGRRRPLIIPQSLLLSGVPRYGTVQCSAVQYSTTEDRRSEKRRQETTTESEGGKRERKKERKKRERDMQIPLKRERNNLRLDSIRFLNFQTSEWRERAFLIDLPRTEPNERRVRRRAFCRRGGFGVYTRFDSWCRVPTLSS
jgi:hypothetical protein